MTTRLNIILALLLTCVLGFSAWTRVELSVPNTEILPDMKYTVAWQAYTSNPIFQNGNTMQIPVSGTIARGETPLHYSSSKEDAVRAGEELRNPYIPSGDVLPASPIDGTGKPRNPPSKTEDFSAAINSPQSKLSNSVERGGRLFHIFCIACHGPKGLGDGLVAQRGFPPPPSLLSGKSLQMKDGQLFHILTYGQGSMSSFAGQLSHDQRWGLINYIRSLQKQSSLGTREVNP